MEQERFLTTNTPKINITIRGAARKGTITTLINSGAKLSIINKKEALELGLLISYNYKLNINGAIGDSIRVQGYCENVILVIAGRLFITNVQVMEGLLNPLILGNPFTINANLKVTWSRDRSYRVKLSDLRGGRITLTTVTANSSVNRIPKDLLREARDLLYLKD